jgi:hypothetical protein
MTRILMIDDSGWLRALTSWLQRYYGFGATFVQLLRGRDLRIEATRAGTRPWLEEHQYALQLDWCSRAAATVRSVGTAWCRLAAGAGETADSDLCARLIGFAAESHDHVTPSELGARAA